MVKLLFFKESYYLVDLIAWIFSEKDPETIYMQRAITFGTTSLVGEETEFKHRNNAAAPDTSVNATGSLKLGWPLRVVSNSKKKLLSFCIPISKSLDVNCLQGKTPSLTWRLFQKGLHSEPYAANIPGSSLSSQGAIWEMQHHSSYYR